MSAIVGERWIRAVFRRTTMAVVRLPARTVVLLLRAYRLLVSPMYGPTCRFYPSCSAYAQEAVEVHGLVRGGWLTARRLGRCHPWNPGGVDLVPSGVPSRPRDGRDDPRDRRPYDDHAASRRAA